MGCINCSNKTTGSNDPYLCTKCEMNSINNWVNNQIEGYLPARHEGRTHLIPTNTLFLN